MRPRAYSSGSTGWQLATPETSSRSAWVSPSCASTTAPGYRVYFLREGDRLILLLTGGDKSTQDADIRTAHGIADTWRRTQGARE